MSDPAAFEIAVIGGGLVGAAIAFGLRSLGAKLVVLDEGDVAHRGITAAVDANRAPNRAPLLGRRQSTRVPLDDRDP